MRVLARIALAIILPIVFGCLLLLPTVTSENGYVAAYAFVPCLFLTLFLAAGLLLAGLIITGVKGRRGLWWLPAGPLIAVGFFGFAFIAKTLELGAYQEQPMRPIVPAVANKVLFKKETSHEEIEMFWTHVIGYPTGETSHWSRPGVGGGLRSGAENGHEVITFSFRLEATEEQKNDIRERIKNYPPIFQYLENVDTAPSQTPINATSTNTKQPQKTREPKSSN